MRPCAVVLVLAVVACAPRAEVTPEIAISPGVEGRFTLMERYRLHDEQRRTMMQRPRVWVENEPDEEPDAGLAGPGP